MLNRKNLAIAQLPAPGRIALFVLTLGLLWAPFAIPIYGFGNQYDPNLASILALALLYVEFLGLLWVWRRRFYHDQQPLKSCGFYCQAQDGLHLLRGIAIGLAGILALFGLQLLLGWATLQAAVPQWRLVLEGLLMALAVGWAEELLFRGWLLTELEQDYRPAIALWSSSLIFALAHYIRPIEAIIDTWPQFFGLLLLGMALVWGKRSLRVPRRPSLKSAPRPGRLSLPIGLHAGLVWGYYMFNVGNLIEYTNAVPDWVTGVDRNPLAGLLGLWLLGIIAWSLQWRQPLARRLKSRHKSL
jgi:membrane protease YdiL (CAAX protease family)